jgi:hypothetical protein
VGVVEPDRDGVVERRHFTVGVIHWALFWDLAIPISSALAFTDRLPWGWPPVLGPGRIASLQIAALWDSVRHAIQTSG